MELNNFINILINSHRLVKLQAWLREEFPFLQWVMKTRLITA